MNRVRFNCIANVSFVPICYLHASKQSDCHLALAPLFRYVFTNINEDQSHLTYLIAPQINPVTDKERAHCNLVISYYLNDRCPAVA